MKWNIHKHCTWTLTFLDRCWYEETIIVILFSTNEVSQRECAFRGSNHPPGDSVFYTDKHRREHKLLPLPKILCYKCLSLRRDPICCINKHVIVCPCTNSCAIQVWTTSSRCRGSRLLERSTPPSLGSEAPCTGRSHPDEASLTGQKVSLTHRSHSNSSKQTAILNNATLYFMLGLLYFMVKAQISLPTRMKMMANNSMFKHLRDKLDINFTIQNKGHDINTETEEFSFEGNMLCT